MGRSLFMNASSIRTPSGNGETKGYAAMFPGRSKIGNCFTPPARNLVFSYNHDNSDASLDVMLLSIDAVGWGE